MDRFEKRLKSLPLARPPESLKRRIFGSDINQADWRGLCQRSINLGWAASLSLAAGLIGFFLASLFQASNPEIRSTMTPTLNIQIIERESAQNVLDFTRPNSEFLTGEISIRVDTENEG